MPARTSARSKKASSPPRSPNAARKRSTRSASTELGTTTNLRGVARRRVRQGSAESSERDATSKGRGGRKASTDLAAVEEDVESDGDDIESIPDLPQDREKNDNVGGSSQEPSPEPEQNKLLPSAQIGRNSGDLNFNSRENARTLKEMIKSKPRSTGRPASRQAQAGPSRAPSNGNVAQTQEALQTWQNDRRDKNKENKRPNPIATKRKMTDPHPEGRKVSWDTQDTPASPSASPPANRKRRREDEQDEEEDEQPQDDEEEESQDEGFQADRRVVDHNRRIRAPIVPIAAPSPKRARHEGASSAARQSEIVENIPIETIVKTQARTNAREAALRTPRTQIRVPWSQHDEQLLAQYIGEIGTSWTSISKQPGWEREKLNFQVQLKDKARNMKVAYLKAGVLLPRNFTRVRLGQKEVEAVRKVHPEYNQEDEIEEEV